MNAIYCKNEYYKYILFLNEYYDYSSKNSKFKNTFH